LKKAKVLHSDGVMEHLEDLTVSEQGPTGEHTMVDLALIPSTLASEDPVRQGEVLESLIESRLAFPDAGIQGFRRKKVGEVKLSALRRNYEEQQEDAAMSRLVAGRRYRIVVDKEFVHETDSVNVIWHLSGVFLDMICVVPSRMGLDAILAKHNNSRTTFSMSLTQSHRQFRMKKAQIPFRTNGRMLFGGTVRGTNDVWFAMMPKTFAENGEIERERRGERAGSTALTQRRYRALVCFIAHCLEVAEYRDVTTFETYPDLTKVEEWKAANNVQ
jgi:hypothetical protein